MFVTQLIGYSGTNPSPENSLYRVGHWVSGRWEDAPAIESKGSYMRHTGDVYFLDSDEHKMSFSLNYAVYDHRSAVRHVNILNGGSFPS